MGGGNHTGLYLVGIVVLLILIPAVAFFSLIPLGLSAVFYAECKILGLCHGVGDYGSGGEILDDTGYFGKGYMFDVEAASAEDLEKKLKGTKLAGLGEDFVVVAQKYHLNPVYIAAHAAHESGWGTSRIAQEKKNLFGYGAYDSCPYECAKTFPTYRDGIMFVMSRVKKDYLTPGGKYYEGETLEAMNIHYATDKEWAAKIKRIMVNFYQAMGKQPSF